jgi:predicted O-methyltransferase YrrM
MTSTLRSPAVVAVLDRLHRAAAVEDPLAKARVRAREAQVGDGLAQSERYELYGDAPLAVTREVGELLYVLAIRAKARRIVEFGASHGVSTIYLAAALRDLGSGSLITSESHVDKIALVERNLADAGLGDLVELRVGDALQTLNDLAEPVDLLFLDGRNDLYLSVLATVEPSLAPGALVAADLSAEDPDLVPYLEHVRDPGNGYTSICAPVDDGLELSTRTH